MISEKRKTVSYILKLIVILSAVVGTVLSSRAGSNSFMGGNRVFMFFTIQSNIAVAAVCAAGTLLLMRGRPIPYAWYVVKLVGTVSITLTGVVFSVMLVPLLGDKAWTVHNTLTHAIVPVAAVADFFVTVSGTKIRKKDIVYVLVPPFFYVVYAGIGYVKGWEFLKGLNYPYFFLNWGSRAGAPGRGIRFCRRTAVYGMYLVDIAPYAVPARGRLVLCDGCRQDKEMPETDRASE